MDNKLNIICPHCGKSISIEEALSNQVRLSIEKEAQEKIRKNFFQEIKLLQEELSRKSKEIDEVRKMELELRRQKNLIEEEKRKIELEKQRQIDEEREKIRQQTAKEILEQQRLKEAEYEKKILDLKKSLEEAQLKASQGSQQTQGEVLEINLEEELKKAFVDDEIQEVKKGEKGADIKQIVKTARGSYCGLILWEAKNTKDWKDKYLIKIKEDLRSINASIAVVVTKVMPKEAEREIFYKDGVWICTYPYALILGAILRGRLIDVAREKFIVKNQETKAEGLYQYITSYEFRSQIEAIVETYIQLKQGLDKERRAYEVIWKNRNEQIEKMIKSTARIVGSISGKVGQEFIPIKELDLLDAGE